MSLADRFICRREGHVPSFTIHSTSLRIESLICTCVRCGKHFETHPAPAEDGDSERSEKES